MATAWDKKLYITLVALTVALGGLLLGFDASVISGVVKFIEPEFNLSKIELGWSVSSITLTAALGMLTAGPLSDSLGRKRLLQYAAILFTLSAVGSAIAPTFFTLIIARLVGGLAVGTALIIAPVYIAEISPPKIRGQMVSFNQLNIVIGISLAFFTNYLILKISHSETAWAQAWGFDRWNWRWMLGLEALPALLYFIGLLFVPLSPRWLVMKGRNKEALEVMKKVTSQRDAATQIEAIRDSISASANQEKVPITELFKPSLRLVLFVGLLVAIFQQIVGINSVLFYAPIVFEQTGIGTNASFIQAILVGLTNLVFTIVAMLIIDRFGRKPLLNVGMAGIVICLFLLAYGFNSATYTLTIDSLDKLPAALESQQLESLVDYTYHNDVAFKNAVADAIGEVAAIEFESQLITAAATINTTLILLGILGFVGSYAASIGPVMWVLFSELFPNKVRGMAISFVGLINLGIAFIVQLVFPWELANFGSATTFLIYAVFAVIGFILIVKIVPETKGKSLEELEKLLVK